VCFASDIFIAKRKISICPEQTPLEIVGSFHEWKGVIRLLFRVQPSTRDWGFGTRKIIARELVERATRI
jgi:hypothetical protein